MKNICKLLPAVLLTLLIASAARADVRITEAMASNGTYVNGHAYDLVELYNDGDRTVDLSGWHLSDSEKKPDKWSFPEGAKLKKDECFLVYLTGDPTLSPGKNKTCYAGFKLSSSGETVYLTDRECSAIDQLVLPRQFGNVSYGVSSTGAIGYFAEATPGKKNGAAVCSGRAARPALRTPGGYSASFVTVEASAPSPLVLRYTLDGSTPTEKSPVFPEGGLKVQKTAPVRVRAFGEGLVPSETVSATYLIDDQQLTPIVCLTTDEKYLFDKKTGSLVKGTGSTPNYEKDWEYPVNIEYYNLDGVSEINQMGTFTPAGHSARQNTQKSIALYARKAWGPERFLFNPFPHRDYTSYKSLLLRSTNSDAFFCRLRDVVYSSLAEGEGLLYQDALCIQVYINGQYWGHYNLREKINKHMIAQYEGITDQEDVDEIDVISRTGTERFTQNGSGKDWVALADFCKTHDLNDPENFAYVDERLDIDSLFSHAAYEIILGNTDFTNVRLYRVPGGKWKYLLFDVEAGFKSLDKTPLEYYIKPVSGKIQGFRHEPLNALLSVPEMKAKFLARVAELLEKHFTWPYVREKFEYWENALTPILPRHISRWKNLTMEKWSKNVSAARYYARLRPTRIPSLLKAAMKLTDAEVETYFGDVQKLLNETNGTK